MLRLSNILCGTFMIVLVSHASSSLPKHRPLATSAFLVGHLILVVAFI